MVVEAEAVKTEIGFDRIYALALARSMPNIPDHRRPTMLRL